MNKLPFASIVVCTYNGEKYIKDCLNALIKQNYPKRKFEIIVVNDCSTDKTEGVISKYSVKLINHKKNKGLASARNTGIRNSKGEIIAFTDDDCIPTKKWLTNLIRIYNSSSITGVGGKIIPFKTDNLILKYIEEKNPLASLDKSLLKSNNVIYRFLLYMKKSFCSSNEKKNLQEVYSLIGANMSFRKDMLEKLGLFDENFRFGAEEEDLCKRFHKKIKDKKLLFTTKAIVFHQYDPSIKKIIKRSFSYGRGNARMFHKHPEQNPTIFPFPILIILSFLIVLINIKYFFIPFFLPLFLYSNWMVKLITKNKFYYFFFPFFQFLSELYSNFGFIDRWIKYRKIFKDS